MKRRLSASSCCLSCICQTASEKMGLSTRLEVPGKSCRHCPPDPQAQQDALAALPSKAPGLLPCLWVAAHGCCHLHNMLSPVPSFSLFCFLCFIMRSFVAEKEPQTM